MEVEVIFEIRTVANILRINAIDVETGTEVTVQMPPNTPMEDAKRLALRKLKYVLNKRAAEDRTSKE